MAGASLEIRPVGNGPDRRNFLELPYRLYRGHPHWVPPLRGDQKVLFSPERHPFYLHADARFFLALRGGRPVGRVAAFVDHEHNRFHEETTGFFGFFESEDDPEAARGLLAAARAWVKERGMTRFRGPVNPSQNEDCGCLLNAYDSPPMIMMPYNPDFYPALYEGFGLRKAMDLLAYEVDSANPPPDKLVRVAEALRRREGIRVRTVDMKRFDEEVERIKSVYNRAWSRNWGFVPMTDAEFAHLAKNLKPVLVPELGLIAEIGGEPVAFALSLPDLNRALLHAGGRLFPFGLLKLLWHQRRIDSVRIITLGVVREHRHKGIDAVLYLDTWRHAVAKGYTRGEMSWILETNTMMNRSARMLGGRVYKTYRMYEMDA